MAGEEKTRISQLERALSVHEKQGGFELKPTLLSLREKWNRIVELLIAGESPTFCSRALGLHYNMVRATLYNPEFQELLKKESEETHTRVMKQLRDNRVTITQRIEELVDQGLDELERLLEEGKTDKIKLEACNSILDRHQLTSRRSAPALGGGTQPPSLVQFSVFLQQAAVAAKEVEVGSKRTNELGGYIDAGRDRESRATDGGDKDEGA